MTKEFSSDGEILAYLHGALWGLSRFAGEYPQTEFKEHLHNLWMIIDTHVQDADQTGQTVEDKRS